MSIEKDQGIAQTEFRNNDTSQSAIEEGIDQIAYAETIASNSESDCAKDPNNPKNWTPLKKWTNLSIVAMHAFMGYFSSAIYFPATAIMRVEFDTNVITINATVAIFVLFTGIGPLFWAPLSERVGRRWVYISAMGMYTIVTIICGISKHIGMFFTFRILQAIFACVGQAIGGGSASDMFDSQDRGKAMSFYMFGTVLGPAIAPMIGGFITQYLGWRWIFYIKTMIGGTLTIVTFLFVKETLYIPPGSQPQSDAKQSFFSKIKFNPFGSLGLLLKPYIFLVCLPVSGAFGFFYLLVTILPATYYGLYDFSTSSVGLAFFAGGVGNTLGSIVAGLVSDRCYFWQISRNNNIRKIEYRLTPLYFGIPFLIFGGLLYGWLLHFHVPSFPPLIGYALYTFGTMFTMTIANTYLSETYPSRAASVVSACNFTRNVLGMMFSLLAAPIRNNIGDGWTYTMVTIINFVLYFTCIPLVQIYGRRWRES
ncbi:major facilitator superfamily domain-containing protein [Phycomyces nitens]|nr:major facilitator superfamily domain-containing protein [Phycomyces nitens]